jgi:Tfp pilus assembly protein FimT
MNLINTLKKNRGNSLAEFAVVIALMATLAATGQVKFSQAGEGGKGKKSANEIEKIAKAGMNFYNQANTDEGAGRFPGQNKWDQNVPTNGGYASATGTDANVAVALADVANFNSYKDATRGAKWCSVFGKSTSGNSIHSENVDPLATDDAGTKVGPTEWAGMLDLVKSPFMDGHMIYTVIAGEPGTSPCMIIADLNDPSAEFSVVQP